MPDASTCTSTVGLLERRGLEHRVDPALGTDEALGLHPERQDRREWTISRPMGCLSVRVGGHVMNRVINGQALVRNPALAPWRSDMEIVLALAAILGISIIVVSRLRRRGRGGVRANAGKQWTTSHAARRRPANGRVSGSCLRSRQQRTAAVDTGAGAGAAYATSDGDLVSDDDLEWGGDTAVASPPPPPALAPVDDEPVWDDWDECEEHATNGNGAVTAEPPAQRRDDLYRETPAEEPATNGATPAALDPEPLAADLDPEPPAATNGAAPEAPAEGSPTPEPVSDRDWVPAPTSTPAAAPDSEDPSPVAAPAAPARRKRELRRKLNPLARRALRGVRHRRHRDRRQHLHQRDEELRQRAGCAADVGDRPTAPRYTPEAEPVPSGGGGGGGGGGCEFCIG